MPLTGRAFHGALCAWGTTMTNMAISIMRPPDFGRAFLIGIFLNTGFIVLEVVFGLLSDSLALLADAGHNLADVLGLVMAWAATELAKKASSRAADLRLEEGNRSGGSLQCLVAPYRSRRHCLGGHPALS